ncbi:hypothetical protein ACC693_38830, partial [Rhizobium ruizarguesonis]
HPLAALAGLSSYARMPAHFGVSKEGRRWRRYAWRAKKYSVLGASRRTRGALAQPIPTLSRPRQKCASSSRGAWS